MAQPEAVDEAWAGSFLIDIGGWQERTAAARKRSEPVTLRSKLSSPQPANTSNAA